MRIIAFITMTVLAGSTAFAQTNTNSGLFDLILKKAEQETTLLNNYGKTLDALMTDLQKKGDLDNFVIVETEKKRFNEEKTVPFVTNGYFRVMSQDYHKAKIALLKKHITELDCFIKAELKEGKVDNAKEAKAEKDKMSKELADLEALMPKQPTAEEIKKAKEALKLEEIKKVFCGKWINIKDTEYKYVHEYFPNGTSKCLTSKGLWKVEKDMIIVDWGDNRNGGIQKWKLPLNPTRQSNQTSSGNSWYKKINDK